MENRQEELEATVLLEICGLGATTGTWWDESLDWSTTVDGCRLFRTDRGERRGGAALYTKSCSECGELSLKNRHEQVESLGQEAETKAAKRKSCWCLQALD